MLPDNKFILPVKVPLIAYLFELPYPPKAALLSTVTTCANNEPSPAAVPTIEDDIEDDKGSL